MDYTGQMIILGAKENEWSTTCGRDNTSFLRVRDYILDTFIYDAWQS